jgi:hypothetical protein
MVISPRDIMPAVGLTNPAIILSRVVLPHPEGPSTDRSSPCFKVKLISLRASTAAPVWGFVKVIERLLHVRSVIACLNSKTIELKKQGLFDKKDTPAFLKYS